MANAIVVLLERWINRRERIKSARDAIERTLHWSGTGRISRGQPLRNVDCCPAEARCEVKPMF